MKKINRKYRCLFFALPVLVLVCTAAATDHNAAAKSAEPAACANIAQLPETMDQNALLHLRAANNLDCLIGIIDEALRTRSARVTLSRAQAERIRNLASAAKDAAQRIGR
jgi:hypothetical protein